MSGIATKPSSVRHIRDALIRNLHFIYKFSLTSLTEMTRLSRRRVQAIVRELHKPSSALLIKKEEYGRALMEALKLKIIIQSVIFFKKGQDLCPDSSMMRQARSQFFIRSL
jgi:hypothetical protein